MKEVPKSIYSIVILCCILTIGAVLLIRKTRTHYARINGQIISVERAESKQARSVGLGNRQKLCDNCGMLFIFSDHTARVFWMKNMQFDLDVLWINDGTIVGMREQIPHAAQEKELFSSSAPVNAVLELSAGYIARHHIDIGQQVEFFDK